MNDCTLISAWAYLKSLHATEATPQVVQDCSGHKVSLAGRTARHPYLPLGHRVRHRVEEILG